MLRTGFVLNVFMAVLSVIGALLIYFVQRKFNVVESTENELYSQIKANLPMNTLSSETQAVTRTILETVTVTSKPSILSSFEYSSGYSKLVFFTIARRGEFGSLRELIGSIHKVRSISSQETPTIHVFGYRLLKREIHEMSLWCNVYYHNLEEQVFHPFSVGRPSNFHLPEKYLLDYLVLREALSRRLLTAQNVVIYIQNGHVIWEDKLEELIKEARLRGRFELLSNDNSVIVTASSSVVKSISADSVGSVYVFATEYGIDEVAPSDDEEYGNVNSCQLCIRADAHNEWKLFINQERTFTIKSEKIKVALLIPTTSKRTKELWSLPFLSIFLPSLPKTITEKEKAKYSIHFYLGYDEEDPIYDNEANLSVISGKLNRTLKECGIEYSLKIIRMGISKAVTFLWNSLCSMAYEEGCDYFYQLNDDVRFMGVGWLDTFVSVLSKQNDFGVVGPHDPAFSCKIMTQAMVSRRHFQIFGWLFPPEFINWHCDTWLSLVYAHWTRCFDKMIIWNGRYEKVGNLPRYRACKKTDFKPLVLFYQQKYLKNANGTFINPLIK